MKTYIFGSQIQKLTCATFLLCVIALANARVVTVNCSVRAEDAAVRLFEYIENPGFEFDSPEVYRSVFSKRLLGSNSNSTLNSVLKAARSTYQDQGGGSATPLSGRLLSPPTSIPPPEPSFNQNASKTIRIPTLSTRGMIEQRMSLSCEDGLWKIDSLSYGPPPEVINRSLKK